MQVPPISLLDLKELEGPDGQERLARTMNEFLTPIGAGLVNGVTFAENLAAFTFTTPYLYVGASTIGLTLGNGWVAVDSPGITKLPTGEVVGQGVIGSGTPGVSAAPFAQLPAAYCPGVEAICATASNYAYGQVNVKTDGRLIPTAGSSVWFSLTGVRFLAADPTPIPGTCWPYTFALPSFFSTRPAHVWVTEIRERDQNAGFYAGAPHWDFTTQNGKPAIKILDVPGLPSGKYYKLTFLVVAS